MPRTRLLLATILLLWASAPAFGELLTPADAQAYRAAFAAARSSDWELARRSALEAREPLPAKILLWLELTRNPTAGFADIVGFADENPAWPSQTLLRQRAEDASDGVPDDVLLPYFRRHRPTSPHSRLRFAEMLAESGEKEAAARIIREIWVGSDVDPITEQAILERHAADIRGEDDIARLDHLVRDGMESAARRQLPRVPEDQRQLAEARLALAALAANVDELIARVPPHLRQDPGLIFERVRWNRRKDLPEQAASLLLSAPREIAGSAGWWTERYIVVRRLLDEHKDRLAYDLIAQHGQSEGTADYAEAEFFAGWIALRRLNDAAAAYSHFTQLYAAAKLPISLARGAYWAGRAAQLLGKQEAVANWYSTAAKYAATYYGQLAASRLGITAVPVFPSVPLPSNDEAAAFQRLELVRAASLLAELGESEIARPFLFRLSATVKTPSEQKLVASVAKAAGCLDVAIAAAKQAGANGLPVLEDGFPLAAMPHAGTAEAPLVLAITRQESAFNVSAVSRSDARGLMQLKVSTAKQIAKSLTLPFAPARLVTDGTYNMTLGRAYLDKMLDMFGGSYVLAVAAYNAGPARVSQWLETYGDPRGGSVDVIDWIELIPFSETRNYVQRVLENLQVYRLRLEERDHAFRLAEDLKR